MVRYLEVYLRIHNYTHFHTALGGAENVGRKAPGNFGVGSYAEENFF